jgi:hypothetical protein
VRGLLVLGFGLRKRLVCDVAFDVGHLRRDPSMQQFLER